MAAVQGDGKIRLELGQRRLGAVVAADLLVAGDQQAAGQVGLGLAAGLEFFHQFHDERQGQGGGIFVIDAAAAEELAVFDARLEQRIGRIHDVDVGHEQHRRAPVRPQHQQGRSPVLFDAAVGNAVPRQEALHEAHAGLDFLRAGVHGLETDEVLGELDDVGHALNPFCGREWRPDKKSPGAMSSRMG